MAVDRTATVDAILDAAQGMTQEVGYNGLSFRDLAKAVGIKSASVHYHFPTKGQLGAAVARRYTDGLLQQLENLDVQQGHPNGKLAAYVAVFRSTLEQQGRMCLCGMLAAEIDGVPDAVRAEVRRFVDLNVRWLSDIIARATGTSSTSAAVRDQAMAIFAALEGAMLVARGAGDIARFDAVAAYYVRSGLLQL